MSMVSALAPMGARAAAPTAAIQGIIRPCAPADLPAVARLFQEGFRDPRVAAPISLQSCLREVFFEHPWQDADLPSRVYEDANGRVAGFIGVLPLRMTFAGQPVRAAVPSSIMVREPRTHPLAGARLLRAFINGPQEISITEPLNAVSQAMWARLGGQSFPSESMEWLRVFRPAALALSLLGDRPVLATPARLLAGAVDVPLRKLGGSTFSPRPIEPVEDADAEPDAFVACMRTLAELYSLRPQWDAPTLGWMLDHVAGNAGRGRLHRRIVYGGNGQPIGCYAYHGRPGRMAWVLQILTAAPHAGPVVDSLLQHAQAFGCAAVKGRTQLRLLDALLHRGCFLFRRHSAAVHSRDPALLAAVRSGDAITSGFAAESWTRLIGEQFT